jgi:glycosyltransferase involved in cell wall biosynthesis
MPAPGKRIDLHCHSDASNKTAEAVLNAIHCPESYSRPDEVYAQATGRGMDFVTLTDHDTIDGALRIKHKPNVFVGEELTCWFPEDGCKMHVLVYGISADDHAALQARAKNIYDVAEYIEANRIAHAVAHPIYRQNDKLERWHIERLLLMFKGFECLNGAHSSLHREAFEPLLNSLSGKEINRLSEVHGLTPRWPTPWLKARVAGSDDHGLLNVGRTWTEFPADATTTDDILNCLREGQCAPGGEAGSSAKLAHTFYSVAIRYYTRHIMTQTHKPNLATTLLQTIAGERPAPTKKQLLMLGARHKLKKWTRRIVHPFTAPPKDPVAGTALLKRLFLQSAWQQFQNHPELFQALEAGLPPLGEHQRMFSLVSEINHDLTEGLAAAIDRSIDDASFTGLFDTIGALLAQQFVLLPYYFAVFHQNKERHLLREITRLQQSKTPATLKVGLFVDTYDEVNGVARFVRDMQKRAEKLGRQLVVHTCSPAPQSPDSAHYKNFRPLLSRPMPYYESLRLNLPPLLEILEWSDRQQFDAVHVSTPGPMGICGWIVSRMLRVPMLATYHTDFPAYVDELSGDHRITNGTVQYMKLFYGQAAAIFARSGAYHFNLRDLGVPDEKLRSIPAGVDLDTFNPLRRDLAASVTQPRRLLYCGRISREKNLPLLVETFKLICQSRSDTALLIAGDGPYRAEMERELSGLPVHFLGFQNDEQLAPLYAGADLLLFPSRTDTLGQVVMEAQACGLPAIVTNEGGPKETVEHNVTGLVMTTHTAAGWRTAVEELLNDEPRRQRMSHAAMARMKRFSLDQTFEAFWNDHLAIVEPATSDDPQAHPPVAKVNVPL